MYKIYNLGDLEKKFGNLNEIDENFIRDEKAIYFVRESKNNLVGYATVIEEQNSYLLKRIFIRAGKRYSSQGTKLMKFIINHAMAEKKDMIVCRDTDFHSFFKKIGFVKKGEVLVLDSIQSGMSRMKEGKKVAIFSILQNSFLACIKIFGGIYGNSRALISDGINSLSDVGSSIAILMGIYFSNKPADEEHPYGHEKIESIIGNMLGVFLLITAFELGKGSFFLLIKKEFTNVPAHSTIVIALISMVIKYFMYRSKLKVGLATDNSALIADAKDSKSDVYSSGGVVIGIVLSLFISPIFDIVVSFVVAVLIFKEGISIIFETSDLILDKQDEDFIGSVKEYLRENEDIENFHDIYMRKSGNKIFLSLHIRVPRDMSVFEAHNLVDNIRENLMLEFKNIKDVIIHIDYLLV